MELPQVIAILCRRLTYRANRRAAARAKPACGTSVLSDGLGNTVLNRFRRVGIECERDGIVEAGITAFLPCGSRRGLAEFGARLPERPFDQRIPEDDSRHVDGQRIQFRGGRSVAAPAQVAPMATCPCWKRVVFSLK